MRSTLKGVSYGRISSLDSEDFDRHGNRRKDGSKKAQIVKCQRHVEALSESKGINYQIVSELFDDNYSGGTTKRPAYTQMITLIQNREIDFIITSSLSRLNRNAKDTIEFFELCGKCDVSLIILDVQVDSTTAVGRGMLAIHGVISELERNQTSERLRSNNRIRLINDGIINGTTEILGLDRDRDNKGYFKSNKSELKIVEKILKMFLELPSKRAVFEKCQELGITGKHGKNLTQNMTDNIINQSRLRYRGEWELNRSNKGKDQNRIHKDNKYQIVKLHHGPLIDLDLCKQVDEKLKDTYDKRKRSGKGNYTYLLTSILFFSDGSKFGGQPAKGEKYRYYFNKKNKTRIRCDEFDKVIIKRIKSYLKNIDLFESMVTKAVKGRCSKIPEINQEIAKCKAELNKLDRDKQNLRNKLLNSNINEDKGLVSLLIDESERIEKSDFFYNEEIEKLEAVKTRAKDTLGINDVKSNLKHFIDKFDKLSRVQQRNLIEKIIKHITILEDNQVRIEMWGEPPSSLGVGRKKSLDSELNGRP